MKPFLVIAGLVALAAVGLVKLGTHAASQQPIETGPTMATLAAAQAEPDQLELGSWSWGQRGEMWAETDGEVTNVSPAPLRSIQAHVSFYDAGGAFITSDTALLDFNPVMPGQTSPFSVTTPWNPAMQTARLQFKVLGGPTVPYRVRGEQ